MHFRKTCSEGRTGTGSHFKVTVLTEVDGRSEVCCLWIQGVTDKMIKDAEDLWDITKLRSITAIFQRTLLFTHVCGP
jgi:hypothetical protein